MFYVCGELVHNKIVTNELKSKGIKFIDNLDFTSDNVILRAHGVAKDIYSYMEQNNITFFDYTCPNVLNIHKIVEEYTKNGYYIFLLGDSNHPENIGTISFCTENSFVIEDETYIEVALQNLKNSNIKNLLVIAQTTFSIKTFNNIVDKIKENIDKDIEFVVKYTICNATEIRQKETEEISKNVEYMIIIGGKNSSNTKKLYDIAAANCSNAVCVESKNELDLEEISKYNVIGIMAGASTPDSSIEEVKQELLNLEMNNS